MSQSSPASPVQSQSFDDDVADPTISNEELEEVEDAINREFNKDVRLNFVQYFASQYPYSYEDFLDIRDIFREGKVELHKPILSTENLCVSVETLKNLFGHKAKFIPFITNDDLEHFRVQLLKHYNITFCRCGCTALRMELDRKTKFMVNWKKFTEESAITVCEGRNLVGPINRNCRRQLRTLQYLREIEEAEALRSREEENTDGHELSVVKYRKVFLPLRNVSETVSDSQPSSQSQSPSLLQADSQPMETTDDNSVGFTIDSQAIVD